MRDRLFRNTLGLTMVQGLNMVIPVLLIPIIASVQGIEAYGRYATVFAYYFFAALFCDYGFDYSSVRRIARSRGQPLERRRIVSETFSAKLILFGVAAPMCAAALALLAGINDVALLAAGALIPATSVVSVHWLYLAEGRLVKLVIPVGIARTVSFIAVLSLYPIWPSLALVVFLVTAPVLFVQVVLWIREHRDWAFSLDAALQAIRDGRSAFYITFASSYIATSSVVALSTFASPRDIGAFAAVERLSKAAFGVAKPFLSALYPEMSAMFQDSHVRWQSLVRRVVVVAIAVGGVYAFVIAAFWPAVELLILANPNSGTRFIAFGFATWLTIGLVNNALGIQGLIASGHEALYATSISLAAAMLTVGYLVLGRPFGALGVLASMLLAEATLLLGNSRAYRAVVQSNAS